MRWTPKLIRKMWPKSAMIRPPHKDKITGITYGALDFSAVTTINKIVITTNQNKSYTLKIKNVDEIRYIKLVNQKTSQVRYWSLHECFKCKTYLKPDEHEFILDNICFKCLKELIQEKKKKVKLNAIIKRKSRKILL